MEHIKATPTQHSSPKAANAPLFKRLLALMYDVFMLSAISMGYWAIATFIMVAFLDIEAENYQPMQQNAAFSLGWILCIVAFYWFFWIRGGQTIGMRAWRLKVVAKSDEALSHKHCLIRIVAGPLSFFAFGMGYFWCLIHKERSAWHDLLSHTRVISLPKKRR